MSDQTLLIVVLVCMTVWFAIGCVQYGQVIWRQFQFWRAMSDVARGVIPADYSYVTEAQKRINETYNSGSLSEQTGGSFLRHEGDINRIRQKVSHIRCAGFDAARKGLSDKYGLRCNPFDRGTGSSKQWVRGYCMGANILDPKPYMDEA